MKSKKRYRFARHGQQAHHRYGMMRIEYARLNPSALVIGWSCTHGFGRLTIIQNYSAVRNEGVPIMDANAYTFTNQPGFALDTECMGPEFAGEVIKALFWAQERGEVIPEQFERACDCSARSENECVCN